MKTRLEASESLGSRKCICILALDADMRTYQHGTMSIRHAALLSETGIWENLAECEVHLARIEDYRNQHDEHKPNWEIQEIGVSRYIENTPCDMDCVRLHETSSYAQASSAHSRRW